MPIREINDELCFVRLVLSPGEIPHLLHQHQRHYPDAHLLEKQGSELIEEDFPPLASAQFVERVCVWGRGHRQVGRILENNKSAEIADALRAAYQLACNGKAAGGVERIRQLRNLGQSFASKQLRFLAPTRAVILDSVIRTNLGYADTADAYTEFLADCQRILDHARNSQDLSANRRQSLRICDIETAVFSSIQGY